MNSIDVAIIGSGPAGLAAGQYAARAGLSVALFDGAGPGGQGLLIDILDNYPGILETDGFGFTNIMEQQAKNFGVEILFHMVKNVAKVENRYQIVLDNDQIYEAYAVIIATGAKYSILGAIGELEYYGKGVSYCGTCDGPFFKNKPILVVGGGDTAFTDALFLSGLSDRIVLVHRSDKFRAQNYLVERAKANPRIEIRTNTELQQIMGEGKVERVRLFKNQTNETYEEEFAAVFIFVGTTPQTALFPNLEKSASGHLITNSKLETSLPGLYAVGDVRDTHFRQVVTACADGALAAHMAGEYIDGLKYAERS